MRMQDGLMKDKRHIMMRGPLSGLAAAARLPRTGPKAPADALTELLLAERRARAPVQGRGEAPLALPLEHARSRGLRLALFLLLRTRHGAVHLRDCGLHRRRRHQGRRRARRQDFPADVQCRVIRANLPAEGVVGERVADLGERMVAEFRISLAHRDDVVRDVFGECESVEAEIGHRCTDEILKGADAIAPAEGVVRKLVADLVTH